MEAFPLKWAAAAMRAQIVGDLDDVQNVRRICTDSREAEPGTLFFALVGEHADGHAFVVDALLRGAVAVVREGTRKETETGTGTTLLVVEDPLKALADLARAYRLQFTVKVVGITGSVGKTSTREMLAHILRAKFNVLANEKNYNNEIGVPLTLFGLNRSHQIAVVEMGMRAAGEIRTLAAIAEPNIAIITSVGYAHVELLGSRQGIAEAKAEILEQLPPGGVAIIPDDLPYYDLVRSRLPAGCRVIRVGSCDADVWAEPDASDTENGGLMVHVRSTGESTTVLLRAPGEHHKTNALLALAAASELGLPLDQAAAALATWAGAEGRMTVRAGLHEVTVLDDCYNAGPESMKSALETLRRFKGTHVAILGDMRELGASAQELHEMVGNYALTADLRLLITVGQLANLIATAAVNEMERAATLNRFEVARFASTEECLDYVTNLVHSGDVVLVKGSRAMQMEQIVAELTGEQTADPHG